MKKLSIALEKGMWAGWTFIVIYAIIFTKITSMTIFEDDLVLTKKAYVCSYQEELEVNGFDGIDPIHYPTAMGWLIFCVAVGFLRACYKPYVPEPAFVPFKVTAYHDGGSLFKVFMHSLTWFLSFYGIYSLIESYYSMGVVYQPKWVNLISLLFLVWAVYIFRIWMKGKPVND
jgi:hypothetical protein